MLSLIKISAVDSMFIGFWLKTKYIYLLIKIIDLLTYIRFNLIWL